MSRYIGNYLRVPASEPTQSTAPGIWSLSEQLAYQRNNQWPPARDPYYNQTVLHLSGDVAGTRETNPVTQPRTFLSDASSNNFLLTPNGDVSARSFSPYASSYSNYFDGIDGALTVAGNAALDLTGDFTIEFWSNMQGNTNYLCNGTQSGSGCWRLALTASTGTAQFDMAIGSWAGLTLTSAAGLFTKNVWTHFAITRSASTFRLFISGIQVAIGTNSGSLINTGRSTQIGYYTESTGTYYSQWYLSNLRIIKGTAVYTTGFTPSTTPLTAITNTSLLTCQSNRLIDNSSNNFTITPSSTPAVAQNSPFVEYDTTSGSGYFDGNADYLTAPASNIVNFASGQAFTFECWFYPTTSANMTITQGGANTLSIDITPGSSGNINYGKSGVLNIVSGSVSIPVGTWNYLAIARNTSNQSRMWVNGVSIGSSNSDTYSFNNAVQYIGSNATPASYFVGYISNVRVVKGTAIYDPSQSTLTVPTAPLTPVTNTQLLTLQTRAPANNQGILDTSPNRFVVTRTGNVAQGSFSPFSAGGWSNYYNGYAGTNLSLNPGTTIGAGQFSVESWIYPQPQPASGQAYGTQTIIFQGNNSNNNSWSLSFDQSTMRISWGYYGAGTTVSASYLLSFNIWSHILVTRDSSNIERIFINGTLVNQRTNTQSYTGVNGTTIRLGSHLDSNWPGAYSLNQFGLAFCGYMSNTRVIAGNIPVEYQTTSTTLGTVIFTPSTSRLTNIAGTILLANQSNRFIDNSNYNSAITINYSTAPGVSVQPFSPFAPTQAYVASQLGGSGYFDGGSDYLQFTDSANQLDLGGSQASIEFWLYLTNTAVQNILSKGGMNSGSAWSTTDGAEYVFAYNSGVLYFTFNNAGGTVDLTGNFGANQWNHVVVATNTSNAISMYINGVRTSGPTTNAITKPTTRTTVRVGTFLLANWTYGYLAGIRHVSGSGAYDPTLTNFPIPTAPPTAIPNTSLLLNFTAGGIVDATGKNNLETVLNARSSTVQAKWGPGSMYFDGASYLLGNTPSNWTYLHDGSSWTVEFWLYPTDVSSFQGLICTNRAGSDYIGLGIAINSSAITLSFTRGVSGSAATFTSNAVLNTNQWNYVGITFTNSTKTCAFFINGASAGSSSNTGFSYSSSAPSNPPYIGQTGNSSFPYYFNGYIDDLRITRGVARTITANPTGPFPIG